MTRADPDPPRSIKPTAARRHLTGHTHPEHSMTRHPLRVAVPAALVLPLIAAAWGGWATITVHDLPDHAVAGRPVELRFTVRQHGVTPLGDLRPRLEARRGRASVTAAARAGSARGEYAGSLLLPEPGDWVVTIRSGFGKSDLTLAPLAVIPAGERPAAVTASARGARLFVAKGCVTCHLHRAVAGSGQYDVGPELTDVGDRLTAEYLGRFLADPSIRASADGRAVRMPDLGLREPEIAALTEFLQPERQAGR
jgi:mono/diheme cytochrome c family protein